MKAAVDDFASGVAAVMVYSIELRNYLTEKYSKNLSKILIFSNESMFLDLFNDKMFLNMLNIPA